MNKVSDIGPALSSCI